MADEPIRSRAARQAAERALIRVVHHYGARPEFVVLGGLVPELLCSASPFSHAGTTDVDVQVNLEIATGSVNAARLERALRNAEFEPDHERIWRWRADGNEAVAEIKFELLADLDEERAGVDSFRVSLSTAPCERPGHATTRQPGPTHSCRHCAARDTSAGSSSTVIERPSESIQPSERNERSPLTTASRDKPAQLARSVCENGSSTTTRPSARA